MTEILAVDPGVRGCGVAFFDGGRLLWAKYVRNPAREGDDLRAIDLMAREVAKYRALSGVDVLALEFPKVYVGSKAKGDPHDLLTLAAIDGALVGHVCAPTLLRFFPREWKGQLDKDACAGRVRSRLDAGEVASIELPCTSLQHNVWDAVGIGLFAGGRFSPHRVIARGSQAPGA